MERVEPCLVPQWLKNTGNQNGGSSVSHSDDHTPSKIVRNKSFVDGHNNDFRRSLSLDKTSSSYFRRSSSSNGSRHLRSCSSFGKNQHDRDWERGMHDSHTKEKPLLGDRNRRYQDITESVDNTLLIKLERDELKSSHSISGKHRETSCNKVGTNSSTSGNYTNGLLSKGSPVGGVNKITFKRDFPSLGPEEKVVTSEVGRVPSPGPSSAIQSLPVGSSANITGGKWTSALAEVPDIVGCNGAGMIAVQHEVTTGSASLPAGTSSILNMAEAVTQGPNRAGAAPQLSVGTQRLEELAIKQSRQLIPVTPSSPKMLVLSSLDKHKTRAGQQQHPTLSSVSANNSPRSGSLKSDASRTNVGKLHVLKPVWEKNVATPVVIKDNPSQASGGKLVNSLLAAPSISGSAATRGPLTNPGHERRPMLERRPTSQAQSRNDFFNSVRKKSMTESSSAGSVSSVVVSSSSSDIPSEPEFLCAPSSERANHFAEMNGDLNCNGDSACVKQRNSSNQTNLPLSDLVFSEEEEAAFLRSLGWEENTDEGGLTEEEINTFFQDFTKYINSKPSLRILQGRQPSFLSPVGTISGLTSSDAKLES
ncbi:uncharacterized protein LOC127252539 [Andrographis paniculata]|uniref:uncharacterized protein LOC127252539 n=1 Tax=Andrographis paniculata TaxID=175694 RepID=UPI0021E7A43B|nr:uncharacterized protein LOC127252539 [Andrographis paniculata]